MRCYCRLQAGLWLEAERTLEFPFTRTMASTCTGKSTADQGHIKFFGKYPPPSPFPPPEGEYLTISFGGKL
jgi:hypothetical protein